MSTKQYSQAFVLTRAYNEAAGINPALDNARHRNEFDIESDIRHMLNARLEVLRSRANCVLPIRIVRSLQMPPWLHGSMDPWSQIDKHNLNGEINEPDTEK